MEKNYKPFNLEDAKNGFPVMNERGDRVEIIQFDLNNRTYPLLGVVTDADGEQHCATYTTDGKVHECHESDDDLVMVPLEYSNTEWVNLYIKIGGQICEGNGIFRTEDEARQNSSIAAPLLKYLATVPVKIEWREGEEKPNNE